MKVGNCVLQICDIFDCSDTLEFGSQGFDAIFFNLRFVHAGCVIVTNLLFSASFWSVFICSSSFEDLVKHISVFFLKDFGNAPTWKGSGDRICSQPSAICVLIEIRACRSLFVEISEIETMAVCLTKNGADQEDN